MSSVSGPGDPGPPKFSKPPSDASSVTTVALTALKASAKLEPHHPFLTVPDVDALVESSDRLIFPERPQASLDELPALAKRLGLIACDGIINGLVAIEGGTLVDSVSWLLESPLLPVSLRPLFENYKKLALKIVSLITAYHITNKLFSDQIGAAREPIKKQLLELCQQLAKQIQELRPSEKILIPGGWMTEDGGHAMLYCLEKQADGTYSLHIFNTGAGSEYFHELLSNSHTSLIRPVVSFTGIPFTHLSPAGGADTDGLAIWLNELLKLQVEVYKEYVGDRPSAFSIYDKQLKHLGQYRKKTAYDNRDPFCTPQRSGTCSVSVLLAYIREDFICKAQLPEYKKFIISLKTNEIGRCYMAVKEQLKDYAGIRILLTQATKRHLQRLLAIKEKPIDPTYALCSDLDKQIHFLIAVLKDCAQAERASLLVPYSVPQLKPSETRVSLEILEFYLTRRPKASPSSSLALLSPTTPPASYAQLLEESKKVIATFKSGPKEGMAAVSLSTHFIFQVEKTRFTDAPAQELLPTLTEHLVLHAQALIAVGPGFKTAFGVAAVKLYALIFELFQEEDNKKPASIKILSRWSAYDPATMLRARIGAIYSSPQELKWLEQAAQVTRNRGLPLCFTLYSASEDLELELPLYRFLLANYPLFHACVLEKVEAIKKQLQEEHIKIHGTAASFHFKVENALPYYAAASIDEFSTLEGLEDFKALNQLRAAALSCQMALALSLPSQSAERFLRERASYNPYTVEKTETRETTSGFELYAAFAPRILGQKPLDALMTRLETKAPVLLDRFPLPHAGKPEAIASEALVLKADVDPLYSASKQEEARARSEPYLSPFQVLDHIALVSFQDPYNREFYLRALFRATYQKDSLHEEGFVLTHALDDPALQEALLEFAIRLIDIHRYTLNSSEESAATTIFVLQVLIMFSNAYHAKHAKVSPWDALIEKTLTEAAPKAPLRETFFQSLHFLRAAYLMQKKELTEEDLILCFESLFYSASADLVTRDFFSEYALKLLENAGPIHAFFEAHPAKLKTVAEAILKKLGIDPPKEAVWKLHHPLQITTDSYAILFLQKSVQHKGHLITPPHDSSFKESAAFNQLFSGKTTITPEGDHYLIFDHIRKLFFRYRKLPGGKDCYLWQEPKGNWLMLFSYPGALPDPFDTANCSMFHTLDEINWVIVREKTFEPLASFDMISKLMHPYDREDLVYFHARQELTFGLDNVECTLTGQNSAGVVEEILFVRALYQDKPLRLIKNKEGKLALASDPEYVLATLDTKELLGEFNAYLCLKHQKTGHYKLLLPPHKLISSADFSALPTFAGPQKKSEADVDLKFSLISLDPSHPSQEATIMMAYIALKQHDYLKARKLLEKIDKDSELSEQAKTLVAYMATHYHYGPDTSPHGVALSLYAHYLYNKLIPFPTKKEYVQIRQHSLSYNEKGVTPTIKELYFGQQHKIEAAFKLPTEVETALKLTPPSLNLGLTTGYNYQARETAPTDLLTSHVNVAIPPYPSRALVPSPFHPPKLPRFHADDFRDWVLAPPIEKDCVALFSSSLLEQERCEKTAIALFIEELKKGVELLNAPQLRFNRSKIEAFKIALAEQRRALQMHFLNKQKQLLEAANPTIIPIAKGAVPFLDIEALFFLFIQADEAAYKRVNPALDADKVYQLSYEALYIANFLQKIERLEALIASDEPPDILDQKIAEGLAPFACDFNKHPRYLAFQFFAGLQITKKQFDAIEAMKAGDLNQVVQLMMGGGKTSVIATCALSSLADGKTLSCLVVPESLFSSVRTNLSESLKKAFDHTVFPLQLKREQLTEAYVEYLYAKLQELIFNRQILLTTPETIQTLKLEMLAGCETVGSHNEQMLTELCIKAEQIRHREGYGPDYDRAVQAVYQYEKDMVSGTVPEKTLTLRKIVDLLQTKAKAIFDEIPLILEENHQTNFPMGTPEKISKPYVELAVKLFNYAFTLIPKLKKGKKLTPEEAEALKIELMPKLADHMLEGLVLEHKEQAKIYILGNNPTATFNAYLNELSITDRALANQLALLRYLLGDLLPSALQQEVGRNFGVVPPEMVSPFRPVGKIIPYLSGGNAAETFIGNWIEELVYGMMKACSTPLSSEELKVYIDSLLASARATIAISVNPLSTTSEHKSFFALTGIALQDAEEKKAEVLVAINADVRKRLAVQQFFSLSTISYYAQRLSSTPQDLPSYFASVQGLTGTPWNRACYNHRVGQRLLEDEAVEGQVAAALLAKECPIHVTSLSRPDQLLHHVLDSKDAVARARVRGFLDPSGLFKDYDTLQTATYINTYLQESGSSLKGTIFFIKLPGMSSADQIAYLPRGGVPLILAGTTKESFLAAGLDPNELFFYYDERHTTGTDLPQVATAVNLISFGSDLTSYHLCQTLLRLRQFRTSQSVEIITAQSSTLPSLLLMSVKNTAKAVAKDLYHAYSSRWVHILKVEAEKIVFAHTDAASFKEVYAQMRPFLIQRVVSDPFQDFGALKEDIDPLEALKAEIELKKSAFLARAVYKEKSLIEASVLETKATELMTEATLSSALLPSKVPSPCLLDQGSQVTMVMQVQVGEKQDEKQTVQLQQRQRLLDEIASYQTAPAAVKEEMQLSTEQIRALLDERLPGLAPLAADLPERYRSLFTGAILTTENFRSPTTSKLSPFHTASRPFKQILFIEKPDGSLNTIFLSNAEAACVKLYLDTHGHTGSKVHLVTAEGTPLHKTAYPLPAKEAFIPIALLNGDARFFVAHADLTVEWLKIEPSLKLHLLSLRALQNSPLQETIAFSDPILQPPKAKL